MRLLSILTVLFISACSSKSTVQSAEWKDHMSTVRSRFFELYPLTLSPKTFNDSRNFEKINDALKRVSMEAHELNNQVTPETLPFGDSDPALSYLSNAFREDLFLASEAFQKGNKVFARKTAQNAIRFCIQCHIRMATQSSKETFESETILGLRPLYRAEWFSATRSFDRSLNLYKQIISDDSQAKNNPQEWELAVIRSLGLAVRVENSPDKALEILNTARNHAPSSEMATQIETWLKDVDSWKHEDKKQPRSIEKAKKLLQVNTVGQLGEYKFSELSLINTLRASAFLHDYIKKERDHYQLARAFFLLAKTYEELNDDEEINLAMPYYKSCIYSLPHSKMSELCFSAYKQKIIPDKDISSASLRSLENLSKPR